ncbi:autotransporter domain-containing protein [Alcaligenaceae bacterium]|nr:autotransporter domain-containing protein [Alcaligenaceae bacterium]
MTIHKISLWPWVLCLAMAGPAWAQLDTDWIYNEAQWGSPDAPFVFSGSTLYTAGTFESGRQVLIGDSAAEIHVQEGTRLHLSGVISNAEAGMFGLQKFGPGTLALSGQNTYQGNTQLHEGTLYVAGQDALGRHSNTLLAHQGSAVHYADGATLFNQQHLRENSAVPDASVEWRVDSGVAIQAGTVLGSAPVVKQGLGTLRLTGIAASYPAYFTVNQGALAVEWHLAGSVQVNQGARLEGSGTVRSATIQPGGVLSPGSGKGDTAVFTVTDQLEFQPGAVFELDARASGEADLVQVAGKALLDGQVMTRAEAGKWRSRTSYTVLQALDGFDGTQFASTTTNLPFLKPVLSYDDQNVYLRLERNRRPLVDVAETPTEKEVAEVVDILVPDIAPNVPPDLVIDAKPEVVLENLEPVIYEEIVVMNEPQAREAFKQLSGSWVASVRSAMLEDSRFVREAVLQNTGFSAAVWAGPENQGRQERRHTPRMWSQAFYSSAERAEQGGTPADTRDIGGLVLGLEQPLNADWRVGGFMGAQHSTMRRHQAMASARIDSLHAGLSLAGRWRDVDLILGVARTWHKIRSQRTVAVAGLHDAISGNYRGRTLQVFGELALPVRWLGKALVKMGSSILSVEPATTVSPFVRMAWVRADATGFKESGGAAALAVFPQSQTALLSAVGLRAEHDIETGAGMAKLRGELAWHHAGGNLRAFSRQRFKDGAGQGMFVSEGLPLARQAWSLKLGVVANLSRRVSLGMGYAGQFSSRRQDHGASLNMAWVF